jgi:glutaredoxin
MYSRAGCHLCDAAGDVIQTARQRVDFEFRIVDIEGNPDLESRYGVLIPVVVVNGRTRFTYRVDPVEFDRTLTEELQRS